MRISGYLRSLSLWNSQAISLHQKQAQGNVKKWHLFLRKQTNKVLQLQKKTTSTSEEDKQSTSEEEKQSTPTSDLFSFKKKQNTPSELKESLLNYQETSCYQQAPSQPPCLKLVDADEISYVKEPTILEESVSENSTG